MTDDDEALDKALILVTEIREALACGTRHYALDGRPLLTVRDVLEALGRDGSIVFEPVAHADS